MSRIAPSHIIQLHYANREAGARLFELLLSGRIAIVGILAADFVLGPDFAGQAVPD